MRHLHRVFMIVQMVTDIWNTCQTQQLSVTLSVTHLSVTTSDSHYVCLLILQSVTPFVGHSNWQSFHLSVAPSVGHCICQSIHMLVTHLSVTPSIGPSICWPLHLSVTPSVSHSICRSLHLMTTSSVAPFSYSIRFAPSLPITFCLPVVYCINIIATILHCHK